jgi:hypothetical protein
MTATLALRDGRLYAQVAATEPVEVRLVRARPRTAPHGELVALDSKKREVWMWPDLAAMDPNSRHVAETVLAERYHEPVLVRLTHVRSRFGTWQVEAVTATGAVRFALRNPERNAERQIDGRFLIRDVLGNRYVIPDLGALDPASRIELERLQ